MALATPRRATLRPGAEIVGRTGVAVPLLIVVIALLFAYRDALAAMVGMWNGSPMYSYGFTVPPVSAYLLWSRREAWRGLTPRPSWVAGGLVLMLAVAMTVAARASGMQVVEQLAFLVALTAAVLLLFGASYLRVTWASLAYLLLMIPIWDAFTEPLHEPFQQRSAAIGVSLLHLIGVPAYREGTFIALPNLQIEVARVCSGVNYLVAVVALGLPLGYVFLRDNWRRALLLGMAVIVAALSNGLRVALIGTLAYYEVGSPLHGPFHVLHGLFVAGVGYVVLFAGLRVLAPRASRSPQAVGAEGESSALVGGARTISLAATLVLATVFVLTGSSVVARAASPVPADAALSGFPERLGPWTADPILTIKPTSTSELFPGADTEILRRYRRSDGAVVDVYVGYFALQHQRKEIVSYRVAALHRAASRHHVIASDTAFDVNYVAPDRVGVERLFWYEIDAKPEATAHIVLARTLWNAIWAARSNGAVVMLSTQAPPTISGKAALADLAAHVQQALAARLSILTAATGGR